MTKLNYLTRGLTGALQNKLAPSDWFDRAFNYFHERSGKAECVSRFAKNNLPLTLAGLGVVWMVLKPKSTGNSVYGDAPDEPEDAATEYVGSRSTNKAIHSDSPIEGLKRGLKVLAEEQPLLLVALGIAAGAAIGSVLPPRGRA